LRYCVHGAVGLFLIFWILATIVACYPQGKHPHFCG